MNVVITMAGQGTRFKQAGFAVPKYMITVKGKTLFEWSLSSLSDFNNIPNINYIFVVQRNDHAHDFIMKKTQSLGIQHVSIKIIEIDHLTDGQATSAMLAAAAWKPEEELIIYNIDTFVEPGIIKSSDFRGDGFIPCFNAPGTHWSFVKLDETGKAIEIREKTRISNNCTVGLYYFKSCNLYKDLYDQYYSDDKNIEHNEKYIAPLYNHMIKQGFEIYISSLPLEKVHVLGTPEEVSVFEKLSYTI